MLQFLHEHRRWRADLTLCSHCFFPQSCAHEGQVQAPESWLAVQIQSWTVLPPPAACRGSLPSRALSEDSGFLHALLRCEYTHTQTHTHPHTHKHTHTHTHTHALQEPPRRCGEWWGRRLTHSLVLSEENHEDSSPQCLRS